MSRGSFRTNRKTHGIFRVNTSKLGAIRLRKEMIPAETKFFRDVADSIGLHSRIEIRDIDTLHTRGFPDTETSEVSEARKNYIRDNVDTIAFITIRSDDGDIIDGNHRWVAFKEMDGIKRVPVLALRGSSEAMDSFEGFVQAYNTTAGHHTILPKKYGRLPHEQ